MSVYHKNLSDDQLHPPFIKYAGEPEGNVDSGKCGVCLDTTSGGVYYNPNEDSTTGWYKISAGALWYGIEYDSNGDTYKRIGATAGYGQGFGVVPEELMPCHSAIVCGLLTEDGNTFIEFDPTDWDRDIYGNTVVRDGSMGNSMQRFTKTHYKFEREGTIIRLKVSPLPLAGFKRHESFIRCGEEPDYWFRFTYEAVLWDDSASAYIGGADSADYAAGDKLASIAGMFPKTNLTIVENRAAGVSMGGVQQYEWQNIFIRLMLAIECCDFNIQNHLDGLTDIVSSEWATYNNYAPLVQTGCTDSLASGTGSVPITLTDFPTTGESRSTQVCRWRGCENIFGHLWEWSDGFNIQNVEADGKSYAWLCQNPADFASDIEDGYTRVGELPIIDGWIADIMENGVLLASTVGGSSTTKFADYYYTYFGHLSAGFGVDWRVALVSAGSDKGSFAGPFFVYSSRASSSRTRFIASRGAF